MRHEEDGPPGSPDDRPLYEQLFAAGFTGPAWTLVAENLACYCYPKLEAWLQTGMIFERCAKKGYGLLRPPFELAPDEVSELAANTVMAALNVFRTKCLAGQGWTPDGGASLTSWVFGDCLNAFPNVWRKWLTAQRQTLDRRADAGDLLDAIDHEARGCTPPADNIVLLRADVEAALRLANPQLRRILHLLALGYDRPAVCEILGEGLTPRAVEGRLHRLRQRLNQTNPPRAEGLGR